MREGFLHADGGEWVERGDTAIIVASRGGSEGLVRELVGLGAEVNARDRDGIGALMYASSRGHAAVVAVLLDNGAKVNVRNIKNRDALMYASDRGHAAVVAVLLDNGADPNTRDHNCSALGIAAARDRLPVCQLLLGRGADLLSVNAYNRMLNPGNNGNAFEVYGTETHAPLEPAILEERREALRVAFAEGSHESQVQRRRDERWARRWPFVPGDGVAAAVGQRALWRRGWGRAFDSAGRVCAHRVSGRQSGAAHRVVSVGRC